MPGLRGDVVHRQVLDRRLHDLGEPDGDELPPPVVRAQPAAYGRGSCGHGLVGVGHAIEHCSTVCEGQRHGLLPLPARRRPPRPRARVRRRRDRADRGRGAPAHHPAARVRRRQLDPRPGHRRAPGQGARAGPVEPLPAGRARRPLRRRLRHRRRRGPLQRRLRPGGRGDGPLVPRAPRLQLQRARHRQHGGAAQVRHRRAEASSGSSRCSRGDPQRLLHDRARRRVLRRHQHGRHRGGRRRRDRHQRPQVVVHRRRPPRLQDPRLHGSLRPRGRPALAPHDGARAARRARA